MASRALDPSLWWLSESAGFELISSAGGDISSINDSTSPIIGDILDAHQLPTPVVTSKLIYLPVTFYFWNDAF